METILTVLSTVGVGALAYAFMGVIRLSKRVNDLELIRMEMVDLEDRLQTHIDDLHREREKMGDDVYRRFDEIASSLDRRFDKVWSDIHKLDQVVNPNKDLVK